jgi:predicted RNase H-like HicB family nuclease
MLNLKYSLIVEATKDPNMFSFYSPDLEGFTGIGHSIEDCIYKARWGMEEHVALLRERHLSVPEMNQHATVTIQNERQDRSAALL